MTRHLKLTWARFCYFILRPICGAPVKAVSSSDDPLFRGTDSGEIDIYASKMQTEFNWFHRFIFPRFFSKMRVDQDSVNDAKSKIAGSIPIYVTTYVGQLEYNYFNYLYLKESLPLAQFANGLSSWLWIPFRMARRAKITQIKKRIECGGSLPHPVSSGYVENLIKQGKSIFVRLRTTRIHDDLFWDIPEEDIIQALISAQGKITEPLSLIPQQFIWAKRPKREKRSIIDWAFGERENPGRLRKMILFWRNYKSHAVVQLGEPLNLKDFLDAHPAIPDEELTRILRSTLLSQTQQERKQITGPALKPRRWMIEKVMESELVQKQIYTISDEKNKDVEHVKLLTERYAKEIAADISYTYIEYANRIMGWVFNTMYDGIQHNHEGLARVKKLSAHSPVVFVPNHLSHVDYLLISTLLYGSDIAVPHVAAGINLAFWPMGPIFRRCGAYFIRRTFAGNPLYKAVFEAYIRLLLHEGYCQEFFIEGGRSRTGKLRQPRMGMLSTLVQAMLDKSAGELHFIPTSITYDKVVEEALHVDESGGKAKSKERFADILKLHKYLKHRYGKIYVNFGEPVSFKDVASSLYTEPDPEKLKTRIVEKIAFEIMNSLSSNSVATPAALVASAFLMGEKRGITSSDLAKNIGLIRSYLEFTGTQLSDALISEPELSIQDAVNRLASGKTVEPHEDFDPVYYAVPEEKRSILDFQKNAIIYHLLPVAYVSASLIALMKKGRATFTIEELDIKIEFLRGLFMCEFAAMTGLIKKDSIKTTLKFLAGKEIVTIDTEKDEVAVTALGTDILRRYKALIANFLDSYRVAYHTCSRLASIESVDEKTLIKTMLQTGRHLLLLDQIGHIEAISEPIFTNALKLFKTAGFLVEELSDKESRDRPNYSWRRSNAALEELQQELELFS